MKKFLSFLVFTMVGMLVATAPLVQASEIDALTSDDPVDYTPKVVGTWKFDGEPEGEQPAPTYRTVLDYVQIGDFIYAGGIIDVVKNASGATAGTFGNIFRFNLNTGLVDPTFAPKFSGIGGVTPLISGEVTALAASTDGTSLFIGGNFTSVDGQARKGLVKWDITNNQLDSAFNANVGADDNAWHVRDLAYVNNRLIIATSASSIGGSTRKALASLDPVTGQATDYLNLSIEGVVHNNDPYTYVYKLGISPNQKNLIILGNFRNVDGQDRKQLAMVKLGTESAALGSWYPKDIMDMTTPAQDAIRGEELPNNCGVAHAACLRDVHWAADSSWFALAVTGGLSESYPGITDSITAFKNSSDSNAQPYWQNTSGADTFHSVRIVGKHVYTGGHNKKLNARVYYEGVNVSPKKAQNHYGLGLINANSGKAISHWNPADDESITSRGEGWRAMLWVPGKGLLVGGDGNFISSEFRQRIGLMPVVE